MVDDSNDPSCGSNTYGETEVCSNRHPEKSEKRARDEARNRAWRAAEASVKEARNYSCPADCPRQVNVKDTLNDAPKAPLVVAAILTSDGWIAVAKKSWEVSFDCVEG